MAYECAIIADSISPDGVRLTSMAVTYQRFIHGELMTHRMFSRNAASSRAIPISKMLARVLEDTARPVHWGANQPGMQADNQVEGEALLICQRAWDISRDMAINAAKTMDHAGLHKQVGNRLLEPYQWMTTLVTATELSNYFALRSHADAQPEFQVIARMMRDAYEASQPTPLAYGQWHLPLVDAAEMAAAPDLDWLKISAGRCARVSYLTHDGRRDPQADITLYERLVGGGHMSPLEHVARPFTSEEWAARRILIDQLDSLTLSQRHRDVLAQQLQFAGNLRGFWPFRKDLAGEHDFSLLSAA
jgi:hypothetical protein